jgi:gliding motility-associated-like protein
MGPVTGPTPPNISTLPIYAPNTGLVNQFFEVTLRYWNICNPYDDPLIPGTPVDPINGDFPPVTTTAIILIVPYPNATINPAGPFCSNAGTTTLTAATPGGTWAGPGITNASTGQFNPSTAGPGLHTITYNVTNAYGCTGTDDIQIRVWARPTINMLPGTNLQVCPGDDLFLNGNPSPGSGAITTHLWTGNTSPLSATNIQNPVFNTNSQGTYNLTYTVTDANGCSRSQNVTVTVNPVSAHIVPDPALACSGINLQLNGNPSGGTGTYTTHTWTGNTTTLNSTTIQNPTFNSNTPGTYNLTYTVYDNNGCWATDNITVTVSDVPVAQAGPDDTTCGLTINLNAIASIGAGSWSKASGPGFANFTPNNTPATSVTVNQYGVYHFVWAEVFGPSCTSTDTVEIVFIQQPSPNAGTDHNLCGLSYTLNATPSVGTGQWIQASGPGTASITNTASASSLVTTTVYGLYEFVWYENNGYTCINSDTVRVAFDVVPVAQFAPTDTAGCPPFLVPFTNQTLYGVSYLWDFGNSTTSTDISPNVVFNNSSTTNVTYNVKMKAWSTYGCSDSITHTVTVHPVPVSQFTSNAIPGCSPVAVNFVNTSAGAVSYVWNFGDGSATETSTNTTHLFNNNGNLIQYYPVSLIANNSYSCADTSLGYVTVFPDPDYPVEVTPDSSCNPVMATISTLTGAQTYYWDFGDGTGQTGGHSLQHFYTNTGSTAVTYTIRLIAVSSLGCQDTSFNTITVFPSPSASYTIPISSGCEPFLASFSNTSTGVTNYYWDFGDGTNSTSGNPLITHSYSNPQTSTIQFTCWLYVENQFVCRDSLARQINVFPTPDYTIDVTPDSSCQPVNAVLTTQPGAQTYQWTFGDQTSETGNHIIQHQYLNNSANPLTFTIQLITTSSLGCKDTSYEQITTLPSPHVNVTAAPMSGCTPINVVFTNSSTGAQSYVWKFGDGALSNSGNAIVNHDFTNNQAITVTYETWLIGQNSWGCRDSASRIINVFPSVSAAFSTDTAGCSPLTIDFNNNSFGASTYSWNFGDGTFSTQALPTHTFINQTTVPLNFPITLTATSSYGCQASASHTMVVWPVPNATFTAIPSIQTFPNATVTVNNTTTPGAWTYSWNFGDGDVSLLTQPGAHTYSTWGTYEIMLVVQYNQCRDTAVNTIQIIAPTPVSSFTLDEYSGCAPLTVSFTNNSSYAESYTWDFGDGSSASSEEPVHTYYNEGTFQVTLYANGPGGQHISYGGPIQVHPQPTAFFNVSPSVVFIPDQPILCFNLSQNAESYVWHFGDGTTSTEQSPNHYYTEEGEYTISLFVNTAYHCTDSFAIPRAVVAKAAGQIEFPSAFTPNPFGPNGGQYEPGDLNNDVFHPVCVGVEEYQLSIFNRWGELIFESKDTGIGWDGYYRNEICKQDVYVWKAKGKFLNGKSFLFAGDVTLIR